MGGLHDKTENSENVSETTQKIAPETGKNAQTHI